MRVVKYEVHIKKEALKFSAAHMTVFADGTKESLHGHNYTTEVTLELRSTQLDTLVSFSYFKGLVDQICSEWNTKLLLASRCKFFQILHNSNNELEFMLCNKRYVVPKEDVVFLDTDNISVECLSEVFLNNFLAILDQSLIGKLILGIQIRIEETPGQGSTASWEAI
jgi:6-pyruvoyltetrahydropterin/6-carboxytetrahydropterin synthase